MSAIPPRTRASARLASAPAASRVPRPRRALAETTDNVLAPVAVRTGGKRKLGSPGVGKKRVRITEAGQGTYRAVTLPRPAPARPATPRAPTPSQPHRAVSPARSPARTPSRMPVHTPSRTPARTPVHFVLTPSRIVGTPPSDASSDSDDSLLLKPTPARVLLRRKFDNDGDGDGDVSMHGSPSRFLLARPPTPPRIAERTERNGYTPAVPRAMPTASGQAGAPTPAAAGTPKRSRSRSPEKPTSVRRLDFSGCTPRRAAPAASAPANELESPFRVARLLASTAPTALPPATPSLFVARPAPLFQPTPVRLIAPLPRQTPGLTFKTPTPARPLGSATPGHAPSWMSARKLTVPVPFSAGASTKASDERDRALAAARKPKTPGGPLKTPARPALAPPPSTAGRAPNVPTIVLSESITHDNDAADAQEVMDVDQAATAEAVVPAGLGTGKKPTLVGLSDRRPARGPAGTASLATADAPRRKPSYPSSLGSGPQARPSARVVSNPLVVPRSVSAPFPVPRERELDLLDATPPPAGPAALAAPAVPQRAVSDPAPAPARPRPSLSMASRREGLAAETSRSLVGLSEALAKLKVRRDDAAAGTAAAFASGLLRPTRPAARLTATGARDTPATSSASTSNASASTSTSAATSRLAAAGHRPRASLALQSLPTNTPAAPMLADGASTCAGAAGAEPACDGAERSLAALMSSTSGIMKGVTAFVDVKTGEGDDASAVFTDLLRSCGAKVLTRPTESCTHIIYRAGKSSTLAWFRRQAEPRPHLVGITWVTRSKEAGRRLAENSFAVEVEDEDVFAKRRKSMEPKSLAASQASSRLLVPDVGLSVAAAKRRSLLYAPKISSPLKKAHGRVEDD
ncbi:hypothetical protein Q5752_006612 [Cryptotrichosporon argae]